MIGTYSLCLSLGVGPFSLRLGANVGSRATVWPNPGSLKRDSIAAFRRFTGSLTVEDVLIPQWPRIRGKRVPCCCWLRLCPAPEGITQALQPACLSRTEIFRAVKNRICGWILGFLATRCLFLSTSYQKVFPLFLRII